MRIARGDSMFAYPEHLAHGLRKIFADLRETELTGRSTAEDFARGAAHILAELDALHPFRGGNGRTQMIFLGLLAHRAGHPLDLRRIDPETFLAAMIASFGGDEEPLARRIVALIAWVGISRVGVTTVRIRLDR